MTNIFLVDVFSQMLNYCKSLTFDEKPNYIALRRMFKKLFYAKDFNENSIFDWNNFKTPEMLKEHDCEENKAFNQKLGIKIIK